MPKASSRLKGETTMFSSLRSTINLTSRETPKRLVWSARPDSALAKPRVGPGSAGQLLIPIPRIRPPRIKRRRSKLIIRTIRLALLSKYWIVNLTLCMTPDEQNLIENLFERLRQADGSPKDPQAEQLIRAKTTELPSTPYLLAQAVIVQEHALANAQARISELENPVAASNQNAPAAGGGSFLSG